MQSIQPISGPWRANAVLAYCDRRQQQFINQLQTFVHFPSISAQPRHARDVLRCARWLTNHLRQIGLEHAQMLMTSRHPLVYAEWRHTPGRPTVLIYGHYDVQPVDPLAEWRTPPFEPAIRDGNLYGRGASDNKGQLFCHVKALEAYLATVGKLPVNVICLFEGEEEIGSPSLKPFLERHKDKFATDAAVISDTRFLAAGRPALIAWPPARRSFGQLWRRNPQPDPGALRDHRPAPRR
jgi:acetylornithine deacetylase/succinyl-diaminopimelate desuccinylase-like protein